MERYRVDNWVKSGKLKPVARGVFIWPETELTWQGVAYSLQRMGCSFMVGGLTALTMQGLPTLSPQRLNHRLQHSINIKVKRLFLWLAERYQSLWIKKIELQKLSMESGAPGSGKRAIAKGGKLDPEYLITVPKDMAGTLHGSAARSLQNHASAFKIRKSLTLYRESVNVRETRITRINYNIRTLSHHSIFQAPGGRNSRSASISY